MVSSGRHQSSWKDSQMKSSHNRQQKALLRSACAQMLGGLADDAMQTCQLAPEIVSVITDGQKY